MGLLDRGILGLSVYDSVLTEVKHEGILREIMEQQYENIMKFKPVL